MSHNKNIRIIKNPDRYLAVDLIDACFCSGKILHVDKQMTGNGFTTGFAKLKVPLGKVDILLFPNVEAIKSKQKSYNENDFALGKNVRFLFGENENKGLLFFNEGFNIDMLCFVIDTFLIHYDVLYRYHHKINRILLDEFHSYEQQSSYRKKLVNLIKRMQPFTEKGVAVTTVTATPNLYSQVDIRIENAHQPSIVIHQSSNQKNMICRIEKSLEDGFITVVFTNSAAIISKLKRARSVANPHELRAEFFIGTNLMRSLVQRMIIVHDPESPLKIVSSRGFEGFDLKEENCKVFFVENRNHLHETFYISNLYQALGRVRKGALSIEYCRVDKNNQTDMLTEREIYDFIERKDLSAESKQSTTYKKGFKKYHPFVEFSQDPQTKKWCILPNESAIGLHKEKCEYNKGIESPAFEPFLKERKITIERIHESSKFIRSARYTTDFKKKMLFENSDLIQQLDLFGEDFLPEVRYAKDHEYAKQFEIYLMCKNYNGQYQFSENERLTRELLQSKSVLQKLLNTLFSLRNKGYENEKKKKQVWIDDKIFSLIKMLILLSRPKIHVPSKIVVHRDYNVFTQFSNEAISVILEKYGLVLIEADIISCNPQMLYLIYGLGRLPSGFYGERKKNKKSINTLLNAFRYDPTMKSSKKAQKSNAKRSFARFNFPQPLADGLLADYFEAESKSQLFHDLTYHEQEVIKLAKKAMRETGDGLWAGLIRKHDALLIISPEFDFRNALNQVEYMGITHLFRFSIYGSKYENLDEYFDEILPEHWKNTPANSEIVTF